MAPVRRYLRITKFSVLECRIYLDNPALAQSWLLNPRDPVLPRVIESIRPLVLPKLREEKERSKKKSSKKKGIKDVVVGDDFEVSIFLTDTSTRHSLVAKQKHFREKLPAKMQSNSTKLIGETNDTPVDVDADDNVPIAVEEDSDGGEVQLGDIPLAPPIKRQRNGRDEADQASDDEGDSAIEVGSDDEQPPHKRARVPGSPEEDDKKKLAMDISYEGFAIHSKVLCLVVKKREGGSQQGGGGAKRMAASGAGKPDGQARMENWITSTQVPVGEDIP